MGQSIRNLLALQEVDLQIISLKDERTRLLDSINQKNSELESQRRELEEREEQRKGRKVEMKQLEMELSEVSDRVHKLEAQQVLVKTNQEYKALSKEIHEAKVQQAHIEDVMLQKMELLEQDKDGVRDISEQLDASTAKVQRETSEIEEKTRQMDRTVADLQAKRSEVAAGIETGLVRVYERIFRSKNPALVPIVNRACQGCHLAVPAAVESVLRRHQSEILVCENCSRILYIPVEESE